MNHIFLLCDAAAAPQNNFYQTLMVIGLGIVLFYFLLIRPEQKRRKQMEALRSSLKKGDRVLAVGIIGIVWRVSKEEVILLSAGETKIAVLPEAITQVLTPPTDAILETPPQE